MSNQADTGLNIGGLYRCCCQTIDDYVIEHAEELAVEGMTLQCRFTAHPDHEMILHNNVWQWNHEPHSLRKPKSE